MNKQEKYIEYIVNDLIDNTKHHFHEDDHNRVRLYFPPKIKAGVPFSLPSLEKAIGDPFPTVDGDGSYLIDKYGAPDIMIQEIYDIYWYRLIKLLLSKYL